LQNLRLFINPNQEKEIFSKENVPLQTSNKRTGGNLQLVDVVFLKSAAVDLKSSSLLFSSLWKEIATLIEK